MPSLMKVGFELCPWKGIERADRRKLERELGYSFVPKDPKHAKTSHDAFNVQSFRIFNEFVIKNHNAKDSIDNDFKSLLIK